MLGQYPLMSGALSFDLSQLEGSFKILCDKSKKIDCLESCLVIAHHPFFLPKYFPRYFQDEEFCW